MLRRLLLPLFFVLLGSFTVHADPATVVSGTITARSSFFTSIEGTLNVLDPMGNPFVVGFASQGGSLAFVGGPGTPVTFQAGIAGTADQGNAAVMVSFIGTGPVIPNVSTPTLDLIGAATVQFSGTAFANHTEAFLGQNPLFTFSGTFNGPVALHFILGNDGLYQLQSATADLTSVPEPVSLLLFGSGLSMALGARRLFRKAG